MDYDERIFHVCEVVLRDQEAHNRIRDYRAAVPPEQRRMIQMYHYYQESLFGEPITLEEKQDARHMIDTGEYEWRVEQRRIAREKKEAEEQAERDRMTEFARDILADRLDNLGL